MLEEGTSFNAEGSMLASRDRRSWRSKITSKIDRGARVSKEDVERDRNVEEELNATIFSKKLY